MPRKKIDVDQIGWAEQIKEDVSINGDLTVTGSLTQNGNQLKITSAGPTSLFLQADTDNITETDTAFVKLTQDGIYLTSYLGYIGNDNQHPEGSSLTNALANTLLLSCNNSFPGAPSRIQIATDNSVRMTIEDDGKVGIGTTTPQLTLDVEGDARIDNHLALSCDGTSDPSLFINHAHIYSKLVSGHAEIFVRDSNGNVTQISPHTPEGEWQYFSKNTKTGKVVKVNMEKMIRKLEEITGESFMEEWYE